MIPETFANSLAQSDFQHYAKLKGLHHIVVGLKLQLNAQDKSVSNYFSTVEEAIDFINLACHKQIVCLTETVQEAKRVLQKTAGKKIVLVCQEKLNSSNTDNSFTRSFADFKFRSVRALFGFYEWLHTLANHKSKLPFSQEISDAFYGFMINQRPENLTSQNYYRNLEGLFLANPLETTNSFQADISNFLASVEKLAKKALIIVDPQNDFCEGGSLQVPNANSIFGPINEIKKKINFEKVIITKDWHPDRHVSFASTHNFNPFVTIEVEGQPQELWPDHCVQGTHGAQISPLLQINGEQIYVLKGVRENEDAYSGFGKPQNPTELIKILQDNQIQYAIVVGLAYDFCVGQTAIDAHLAGFTTLIVDEATKAALSHSEQVMTCRLKRKGISVIPLEELLRRLQ